MVGVCLLVAAAHFAAAQRLPCTKTFALDTDASWHVDANWLPVGVPGPTDVACILASGDFRVVVSKPVTVAGVEISGPTGNPELRIESTAFTLNGPGLASGASLLKLEVGSELRTDGGGAIEVLSNLKVEDSTIGVDVDLYGWLKVEGDSYLIGDLTTHPGSVIIFEGTAGSWLTVDNGFDNRGDIRFGHVGQQGITVESGLLVNTVDGSITTNACGMPSGEARELHANLVNDGLIDINGVGLKISAGGGEHLNQTGGRIEVSCADLEINLSGVTDVVSNFTNYGTITVADESTMRVFGADDPVDVVSNFTNYGTITVAENAMVQGVGLSGPGSSLEVVNSGLISLAIGSEFLLDDASFDNPPDGDVIGDGTLDLTQAAAVSFEGTLSPGASPGILTVAGSIELGADADVFIEVGGESPGSSLDRLDVTNDLTAGGLLEVELIHPYHPEGGEQYQVLTFNQLLGAFDTILLPPLQYLLQWQVVTEPQALWLEVDCSGTQLGIEIVADNDPVSVGDNVTYYVTVTNHSAIPATNVVITDTLPASLIFDQLLSSPECVVVGPAVECTVAGLAPGAVWHVSIIAEAAVAGPIANTAVVDSWECDTELADNQSTVVVNAVEAERCDANYDLSIDSDDVAPAVNHIFGETAAGNPDCRIGGGVTADDVAAIIEASFL